MTWRQQATRLSRRIRCILPQDNLLFIGQAAGPRRRSFNSFVPYGFHYRYFVVDRRIRASGRLAMSSGGLLYNLPLIILINLDKGKTK